MLRCWLYRINAADLKMTDSEWWAYLEDWSHFTLRVGSWNG